MVRKTRITRRHKRSHKRSNTLHRKRYGKGRKGRKCRDTRRELRGGDIDIVLAGDEGLEALKEKDKGMRLLKSTFDSGIEKYYVKLKTFDGYVSKRYRLDKPLMDYIQTNYTDKTAVPKIKTVIMCDDDRDVEYGFNEHNFIDDYHRSREEIASKPQNRSIFNLFRSERH